MQVDHLGETQRRIIELLAACETGASIDDLVAHLGITRSAVRAHVGKLETLGYLSTESTRRTFGRPHKIYALNATGKELLPRQYAWLATAILQFLCEELGSEATAAMMSRLGRSVADSMQDRFPGDLLPKERVAILAEVMNDLGYRARVKQSDVRKGLVIEASNCAYHLVAQSNPELCNLDRSFLTAASGGMKVTQDRCIAKGDSICRFCLQPERETPS